MLSSEIGEIEVHVGLPSYPVITLVSNSDMNCYCTVLRTMNFINTFDKVFRLKLLCPPNYFSYSLLVQQSHSC